MIVCSHCTAQNRDGSKFCLVCGQPLDTEQNAPFRTRKLAYASDTTAGSGAQIAENRSEDSSKIGETDAPTPGLTPRPVGALFDDRFLYGSLVYSIPQQMVYTVTEAGPLASLQFRRCQNPNCGAVHATWENGKEPEPYCTVCGSAMQAGVNEFLLTETLTPPAPVLAEIEAKGLAHAGVRPPVAIFQELVGGLPRYCVVTIPTESYPSPIERNQALRWMIELARTLDYLFSNGISFNGQINETCFGRTGERLVWSYFDQATVTPNPDTQSRSSDLRGLGMQLFKWLTGKSQYGTDPNLPMPLSSFLDRAISTPGFKTGEEFASALEQVLEAITAPKSYDYRIGRRTHVGKVRSLNEDSLMSVEFNRTIESVSFPVCVVAVADGMGGHSAGEVASSLIVNTLGRKAGADLSTEQAQGRAMDWQVWLREAVTLTNRTVYEMRKAMGTDMGSTVVAAILAGNKAYVTHVGDSRVYLMNSDGVRQLTIDHSLVARLVAAGQIKPEDVRSHPQRNIIIRTIGEKAGIDLEVSSYLINPGDRILLCSDGLWEMMEDQDVYKIVMAANHPQEACDRLVDAANAAGGEDNISVVIVELVEA